MYAQETSSQVPLAPLHGTDRDWRVNSDLLALSTRPRTAVAAQHVSRGDKARLELPPLAVAGPRETGEMPRHPCTFHRMRTENQMRAATEKPSPPPFRSVPSVSRPYDALG